MRRREFVGVLGGIATLALTARAQQLDRTRNVGILMPYPESDSEIQGRVAAFRDELRSLGWVEGENLRIHARWATDNLDRVRADAAELVNLGPDAILITGGRVVRVMQQQTRSIPIVFVGVTDPLGQGVVQNLARPGGNMTGISSPEYSVVAKLLEILKQAAPDMQRAALVFNPENPSGEFYRRYFEAAAQALAVQPAIMSVRRPAELERSIEAFARESRGGLIFPSDLTILAHRHMVTALASRYRMPAIYSDRTMVTAGGLISYSADRTEMFRRGASYVNRVLHGEHPGELPVQQPERFELVVNLTAAKAIGIRLPSDLVARADEVIE
ncbi:MAG TPA: ABC transporter substrate-binding protein [Alphaproteobacteria bacterium]|nr:ABC transporter substrate-binding protein [Alphaproteobacteria bacterium]